MNKSFRRLQIILVITCFLSSCYYTKSLIQTDEDIKAELHNSFPKIIRAYKWSSFEELVPYLQPAVAAESVGALQKFYSRHKIKEVDTDSVDFEGVDFEGGDSEGDKVKKAYQLLVVKTFSPPRYTLETHVDQLTWEFSTSHGGWKITRVDVGAASNSEKSSSK